MPYKLTEKEIIEYLIQMLEGISHMHERNIIRRLVRPSSFFITEEGEINVIKLGCFGINILLNIFNI